MNLLIAKARELLKTDPYFNDQRVKLSRRKAYENRFIVKFVAKAEATDPKFVKPWNGPSKQTTKRRLSDLQEVGNETDTETSQDNSEQVGSPMKRTYTGSSRKRKQTRKRKNKRKTYRGIRLF